MESYFHSTQHPVGGLYGSVRSGIESDSHSTQHPVEDFRRVSGVGWNLTPIPLSNPFKYCKCWLVIHPKVFGPKGMGLKVIKLLT